VIGGPGRYRYPPLCSICLVSRSGRNTRTSNIGGNGAGIMRDSTIHAAYRRFPSSGTGRGAGSLVRDGANASAKSARPARAGGSQTRVSWRTHEF